MQSRFEDRFGPVAFVQDNESMTFRRGTIRGLHFQRPPYAQSKLVRCLSGAIWDVAVDLRREGGAFGKVHSARLSGEGGEQFFVPEGFAHGFLTLTDDARVAYKVSAPYAPGHEAGVAWDDPDLAIDWPLEGAPLLSDKDAALPRLARIGSPFSVAGAA